MGNLQLLFLSLLLAQVSGGTDPIIRVQTRPQGTTEDSFRALHLPRDTRVTNDPSHLLKLDPSQLGLLFSHLLGLAPSQGLAWGGVTSTSFLSRPRALALLTVEGLPGERGLIAPQGTTSYRAERDRSAAEWVSGAFNPSLLKSRIIEMAGGHQPLMVSVSGEERVATAGPKGVRMIKRYYNSDTNKLSIISDYKHTEESYEQVVKQIESLKIGNSVSVSKSSDTILVKNKDGNEVAFNLKFKADMKFFTEILIAMDTIESMRERKETADNIPDLIAISFSALKDLRLKYGDSSPQVSAAVDLYSALLPELTNQIAALYQGQVAVFALSLAWTNPTGHAIAQSVSDLYNAAYSHLETQDMGHFQLNFPEIILNKDSESIPARMDAVCSMATKVNERTQLIQVSCPHRIRRQTKSFSEVNNNTNNTVNTLARSSFATEKTVEFPYMFIIILLIVLLFVISLFAISWAMWFLDPGMDSIIYRTTEPAKLKLQ